MDWLDFIDIMVLDEKAARAKYRKASRIAQEAATKEVFRKLAYEEDVHLAVLQKFRADLEKQTESK